MNDFEKKILKMLNAVTDMENAHMQADEASRKMCYDSKTVKVGETEISLLTDEALKTFDEQIESIEYKKKATKKAIKAVTIVADAFGLALKKKLRYRDDIHTVCLRLVERYEEMEKVMHQVSRYDRFLELKEDLREMSEDSNVNL